jgi:hypothetical protein
LCKTRAFFYLKFNVKQHNEFGLKILEFYILTTEFNRDTKNLHNKSYSNISLIFNAYSVNTTSLILKNKLMIQLIK